MYTLDIPVSPQIPGSTSREIVRDSKAILGAELELLTPDDVDEHPRPWIRFAHACFLASTKAKAEGKQLVYLMYALKARRAVDKAMEHRLAYAEDVEIAVRVLVYSPGPLSDRRIAQLMICRVLDHKKTGRDPMDNVSLETRQRLEEILNFICSK